MTTVIIEIEDEIGNIDMCECESGSTRVISVIRRIVTSHQTNIENREYSIQYSHACGYRE
jgi:hypothetical protein